MESTPGADILSFSTGHMPNLALCHDRSHFSVERMLMMKAWEDEMLGYRTFCKQDPSLDDNLII
jgi:hypothetical protein